MLNLDGPVPEPSGLVLSSHNRLARLLCEPVEQTISIATESPG